MLSHERRALTSSVYCTRTPATLRPVEPIAGATCASNTATFNPRSLNRKAHEAPIIPAPIINTSALTFVAIQSAFSDAKDITYQDWPLSLTGLVILRCAQN